MEAVWKAWVIIGSFSCKLFQKASSSQPHFCAASVSFLHLSKLQTGPFIVPIMLSSEPGYDNFPLSVLQIGCHLNVWMEAWVEELSRVHDEYSN